MEDVTITDSNCVIVCDTKSFRLGRSQAAPNVKDVLKHADIEKWLSAHNSLERLGGLVTFPSQHDWKKGSDFYQYTTDASLPTVALYYEHLSYFLIASIDKDTLIKTFRDYSSIFPKPKSKNDAIGITTIRKSRGHVRHHRPALSGIHGNGISNYSRDSALLGMNSPIT